jgi:hypothetical protein
LTGSCPVADARFFLAIVGRMHSSSINNADVIAGLFDASAAAGKRPM